MSDAFDWQQYEESNATKWSREENKIFEDAIFVFHEDTKDRWEKVAAWIPGKTPYDVFMHNQKLEADIKEIEAGNFDDIPHYTSSSSDQEGKKKLVKHWAKDEHRRFLMGLEKYGKGEWILIAKCVATKDHKQVASHAQKYDIRQITNSEGKKRKRISIHDMTLETAKSNKMNESHIPSLHQNLTIGMPQVQEQGINHQNDIPQVQEQELGMNHHNDVTQMSFNPDPDDSWFESYWSFEHCTDPNMFSL